MAARDATTADDHARIRSLIESCANAIRAKDAKAVAAHYAADLVAFDMAPPLKVDRAAYEQNYARWFAGIDGPIDYQTEMLQIAASGDAGFCCMINRIHYTGKGGQQNDGRVRVTLGLRKQNGKWLAVHEHVSVPFDMSTGQALMNLSA